jgi:hypothetical protein
MDVDVALAEVLELAHYVNGAFSPGQGGPPEQAHDALKALTDAARAYVRAQTSGRWDALVTALGEDHLVGRPPAARFGTPPSL